MTVAELIEKLLEFGQDLEVYTWDNGDELNDGDWCLLRPIDVNVNPIKNRLEIL